MKNIFLISIITILNIIVCNSQKAGVEVGNIGVQTKIGLDNQYLLITSCQQASPADISGLKVGDRIYLIDDKKISEMTNPMNYLHTATSESVKLIVSRYCEPDMFSVTVRRMSGTYDPDNYMTEETLYTSICSSFSYKTFMSSIELLNDDTKDMFRYKTYDFEFTSMGEPLLEKTIFNELERQLNLKGMQRTQQNPELLIIMNFYSGQKEKYIPPQQIISTKIKIAYNWYWGRIPVPITESTIKEGRTEVTYLNTLSLKFLDAKEISLSKTPPVVWSGSISEVTSTKPIFTERCVDIFKLMLYQYPEVWRQNSDYFYLYHYSYSGLVFRKIDMQTITDVIPASPAEKSGIKKGDIILSINGLSYNRKYIFNGSVFDHAFEYLFMFDPYFLGFRTKDNTVDFEIKRNGKKMTLNVKPEDRVVYLMYNK